QSFKEKVERLYARPDANADPKLQVMTIHKSKGLEFDHVFIPALERNPRSNSSELLMWLQRINHRGENDLLIAPLASRAFDTNNNEANSLYDLLRDEDKLKLDFEATRLLYVGCTRAIKHLHLYANLKIDPKKSGEQNLAAYEQLRPPGNSSLLAKIWPTIKREAQVYSPAEASGSTQATGPHPSRDFGLRLADNWRAASLNNGELLAAFRGREFGDADNNPEPFRSENTFHRHLGTVMHRALRQICIDGQGQWPAERRLAQTELWQQQLQQLGLWPDGARQGATLIEKAMAL
ncbi:MAG: hypothetical protein OIF35_12835, partial [Cellvibrionaceae bacterium]|nr:hypothetical protein [Cellvibrionaceae bacterium]